MKVEKVVLCSPSCNSPYGFFGRRATLNSNCFQNAGAVRVKIEVAALRSPSDCNSPYGLCGRKATLN